MISLETIELARERISKHIRITPIVMSAALSELAGTQVSLKLEHRQLTGSFKLRGATNAVLQLTQSERDRGVVAASTGNHGRALSYAADLALAYGSSGHRKMKRRLRLIVSSRRRASA